MADEIIWLPTPDPIDVDLGNSKLVRVSRTHGKFPDGRVSNTIKVQEAFGKGKLTLPASISDDAVKELFQAVRSVQKEV